jgi:SAM-dependent methyltransferase
MIEAGKYFRVPLLEQDGILVPEPELSRSRIGVTEQFLENAENYHERYHNTGYFKSLIEKALSRIGRLDQDITIVDVGSGSGNTVLPLLDLFPGSTIIAADISPDLLKILMRYVAANARWIGRVIPVCTDVTSDYYKDSSIDLVVGGAILHHLIDPGLAIAASARALVPGGHAFFFEPFENGSAILRIAYTDIVQRAETEEPEKSIDASVIDLLKAFVRDYEVRAGSDKTADIFREIDDKWLFTKSYVGRCAARSGCSVLSIDPLHGLEQPFTNQTIINLRLAKGLAPDALPLWAWDRLGYYDAVFSPELREDLLIEGCIIMQKD